MDTYTPAVESKSKILVIDDAPENIDLIEQILADLNYEIYSARSGDEGLECLDEISPDLILLDVVMPGMSGFEVARQVKSHPHYRLIPVIMITALESREDRIKGLDAGVDDFITKPVNVIELRARISNLLKLRAYVNELEHAEQVIFSLARAVEAKDKYTEGHCERMSSLAAKLGERLGLNAEDQTILRRGGILHDIGKIAIHESILLKEGPLTEEEFEIIKTHPGVGERICAPLKTLQPVLPTIRYHQERFDGSGYPDGLEGNDIPVHARIIGVVDCYDALITKRSYRGALSSEEALEIIEQETRRGLWDPYIARTFIKMMEEEYTLVEYETV